MCVESRDGRKLELEASGIQISPPREPHGATDGEDFGLLLSGGGE